MPWRLCQTHDQVREQAGCHVSETELAVRVVADNVEPRYKHGGKRPANLPTLLDEDSRVRVAGCSCSGESAEPVGVRRCRGRKC